MRSVIVPSGSPGQTRFMFLPSIADTRCPASTAGGLIAGENDEPAFDRGGVEFARDLPEHERTLVLVAVIAAPQRDRRPMPVADHAGRKKDFRAADPGRLEREHHLPKALPLAPGSIWTEGASARRMASSNP